MTRLRTYLARLLAIGLACAAPALAWAIQTGDVIVADYAGGLLSVNPANGAQTRFSGPYSGGGGFNDVATDATGNVFALTPGSSGAAVVKIDAATLAQTVITSGDNLVHPSTIDLAPDGSLFVVDTNVGLVRVDAATGEQTVFLGGLISVFAVGASGNAYILRHDPPTSPHASLYSLDLTTKATVLVSATTFSDVRGMAVDANGNVLVVEHSGLAVKRVYPGSGGAVAALSSGGLFMTPWGVTVDDGGSILVTDYQHEFGVSGCDPPPGTHSTCNGALIRVDPVTGAQTIVSQQGIFWNIEGVAIYLGPNTTPARTTSWGSLKSLYR
jgi:sugar lactone lactonase YvrE